MNPFYYVSVIPNCVQDSLATLFLSLPKDISVAETGYSDNQKPNNARVTNWIKLPLDVIQNTTQAIQNLYNNQLIHTYKQSLKNIESPQLLYYPIGGKYDAHNDSEDFVNGKLKQVCDRDVTILVYLNDDYEGGELEFKNFGVSLKPKARTLIAFPSYIEYTHQVHPVTSGERYTIVSWIKTEHTIYPRPWQNDK